MMMGNSGITSMFRFLDAHTLRARLCPAVIAAAPALAAIALLISWSKITLSNVIATGALLAILFALADFARKQGKQIEPGIYKEMGGKPSVTIMRHRDGALDVVVRDRYRNFLAQKVKLPAPTATDEDANPVAADAFYEQCGTWLRENTRDTKKFAILFNENVTYGFRRNLFGLKWPALSLNVLVVAFCGWLISQRWPIHIDDDMTTRMIVVLVVAAVHALHISFVVTKRGLKEAARAYARQLILSCETFMAAEKPVGAKTAKPRNVRAAS
jgi:hypothetical protein